MRALVLFLAMAAAPASGQERITADQFLDRAIGRTLTFNDFPSGFEVGVEEFLRRDLSVWRQTGGQCVYGTITIEEGKLCFDYDDQTEKACWWTFAQGDRLFVLFANRLSGEMQEVTKITDDPLGCPLKPSV